VRCQAIGCRNCLQIFLQCSAGHAWTHSKACGSCSVASTRCLIGTFGVKSLFLTLALKLVQILLMARPLRIQFENAYYHVTCRGNARQEIFSNDSDRSVFVDLLERSSDIYQTEILAYILMSNHFHLLVKHHWRTCRNSCGISTSPIPRIIIGSTTVQGIFTRDVTSLSWWMRIIIFKRFPDIFTSIHESEA